MTDPLKERLRAAMREQLLPDLKQRGFAFSPTSKAAFPTRYTRILPNRIDTIEFQWDKYGRPFFIINFRSVESRVDVERATADAKIAWRWNGYFRASASKSGERWFGPRGFWRLASHLVDVGAIVAEARARLGEIDAFMRGGTPSRYLHDTGPGLPADRKGDLLDTPSRTIGK